MGCSNEKMVQVAPQPTETKPAEKKQATDTRSCSDEVIDTRPKRMTSATSNASKRSKDSAFVEGDTESLASAGRSSRGNSGLRRTLRSLQSKKSIEPLKDESSVLQQLRSEGLLLETNKHQAKSGLSFQLLDGANQPRRLPPRLQTLEKRQKRRKLLTQQDIEAKLEKAELRRKEVEAERMEKIQSVTAKSDVHHALDSFVEHQKQKKEQVIEKVDTAAENRAKKFREMREKLREKEAHAALVRQRKKTLAPLNNQENATEQE